LGEDPDALNADDPSGSERSSGVGLGVAYASLWTPFMIALTAASSFRVRPVMAARRRGKAFVLAAAVRA
jgi:hypothetical protein